MHLILRILIDHRQHVIHDLRIKLLFRIPSFIILQTYPLFLFYNFFTFSSIDMEQIDA